MDVSAFANWRVEYNSGIPVYRQIINRVCAAVATGEFHEGDQLPTIRALHERLGINPNTVAKAYRELELKGVISSERGNGSFISAPPPATPARQKEAKLRNFYTRVLAEAASHGLTESELLTFIKERNA